MLVQIISDVACPWCRIGKRNLRQAAAQFTEETGEPVSLAFLPFLLDPVSPEEIGGDFRTRLMERKGMTPAQMDEMTRSVTRAADHYGLTFRFDRLTKVQDTLPAHELMSMLPERYTEPVMDLLMTAYFEEGEDVGDVDTLLRLASRAGVPQPDVNGLEQSLRSHSHASQVRAVIQQIQMSGVHGVPFFILDGAVAVNGAQAPETFVNALMQAWQARQEVAADG